MKLSRCIFAALFALFFALPAQAALLQQWDIGAGANVNITTPSTTGELDIYCVGGGGGGGGGGPNAAGTGGSSGARGLWVFEGSNLASVTLNIATGTGGLGGAGSVNGGVPGTGGSHTIVSWPNGLQLIFGGGEAGVGSTPSGSREAQEIGRGGNIASNTVDQGGTASFPTGLTVGQFNLGSDMGTKGGTSNGGHGGNEGDAGGGGGGGDAEENGENGQGGYCHLEARD